MRFTKWEIVLLKYYLENHKAKWIKVYNNKHPVLATKVMFYTIFKRKRKDNRRNY